jgi:hypothetical protein
MDAFDGLTSTPQLEGPKRHHYISRFYLEGFADSEGLLSVFDRKDGTIRRQQPKDTTVVGHFYTFFDEQDRQRFELEKLFSVVETRAASALKTLTGGRRLSHEEREYLSLFIAMTAIRTPAALEEARLVREEIDRAEVKLRVSSEQQAYAIVKEFLPSDTIDEKLREVAAEAYEMVSGDHFSVTVPHELARQMSLKQWALVAELLYKRDWTVVEAPAGHEYMTSDSPAVLAPLEGTEDRPLGFGSSHAHVLFPLSRKLALVMNGDEGRFRRMSVKPEQADRFNSTMAADCYRFAIGTRGDSLRRLVDGLGLTGTQWTPRMEVGVGPHPVSGDQAIWIRGRGKRSVAKR